MLKTSFAVTKWMVVMVALIQRTSATELRCYGADPDMVSVSGVSSGANMAVQLHIAFSSTFMGVGAVAGAPYYCAQGNSLRETSFECSSNGNPARVNIIFLKIMTEFFASTGKVDNTINLASDRVYIFSGTQDVTVQTSLVKRLENYYILFIPSANIKTEYTVPAGHAFITENFGNDCQSNASPFINDCDYNQAYEILNHIYGNLQQPTSNTVAKGQLLSFNQSDFFPKTCLDIRPMGPKGYVYIPTGCQNTTNCKLHVALHGCQQTPESIGDDFYTETGYNEVGELNDIIILYPQAVINESLGNPLGCWDWWGYTDCNYAFKTGWQVQAIKNMVDRIAA